MAKPRRDPDDPDPQLIRFGQTLRRERTAAKLSQDQLADLARMSQGEVSMFERGKRDPGLLTVVSLARALHKTPAQLIDKLR